MSDRITVNNLYKVFGPHPDEALSLIEKGFNRDEIYEQTGMTVAVQAADFAVRDGEVFVVMGLSGSGKSTLVRMLNRLIEPTAGTVFIGDADITRMTRHDLIALRRKEISMVFQSFALMPHQTVLENAAFGLEVAGIDKRERYERAMRALDSVGLKANANSYPRELSGGMQQRVGLARALATDPSILLMDEAFSALDPLIRTEMQDELLRLQAERARTVVFISHDLDEALRIGDRIAVLQDGRVVQVDTPESILREPANDYVRAFFRGVDRSQIFTAGDIARPEMVTVVERPGVSIRAALQLLHDYQQQFAVVTDRAQRYHGMVSAESLLKENQAPGESLYARTFLDEVEPAPAETPLADVLPLVARSDYPVPVVDGDGRYIGAISKTTFLESLDRGYDTGVAGPDAEKQGGLEGGR